MDEFLDEYPDPLQAANTLWRHHVLNPVQHMTAWQIADEYRELSDTLEIVKRDLEFAKQQRLNRQRQLKWIGAGIGLLGFPGFALSKWLSYLLFTASLVLMALDHYAVGLLDDKIDDLEFLMDVIEPRRNDLIDAGLQHGYVRGMDTRTFIRADHELSAKYQWRLERRRYRWQGLPKRRGPGTTPTDPSSSI